MKHITTKEFAALTPIDTEHKQHTTSPVTVSAYQNLHIVFTKRCTLAEAGRCVAKITADDYYKLYVNGVFVCMGPSPSPVAHQSYNEIALSPYLHTGENLFVVHVYYQGLINRAYVSGDNRCAMAFELWRDGALLLESDATWECHIDTHYTGTERFGYDTQFVENPDYTRYDAAIYDGTRVGESAVAVDLGYVLKDAPDRLIETEIIKPVTILVRSENEVFVDFGKEYVGYPMLTFKGARGQAVTLRMGEEVEESDPLRARGSLRCSCNYNETVTLSGGEDHTDFFEYRAFRYLTVEGENITSVLQTDDISLLARHASYANDGARLTAGEELVRDIWELCEHTAHYATQEGFLDCPTREKGQYLGDFTVSGLAQMYLTGEPYLYRKVLFDFANSRAVCPGLMAVYPASMMQEIADFSLQYPLQVLNYYRYTGDRETVAALFPVVKGLLEHFASFARADGLLVGVTDKWNIVDWPTKLRDGYDLDLSNPIALDAFHNVINAFYVGAHICTEALADALGIAWEKQSPALVSAFHRAFYNKKIGLYTDTPTSLHTALHSNVLPAFFGFALPESRVGIAALIREKKLACGVQFSYFVLGALSRLGEYALEYELITDRGNHSWFHMLEQGATTLFEAWGKEQKRNASLCHPWASAPIIALCHDHKRMQAVGIEVAVEGFAQKGLT